MPLDDVKGSIISLATDEETMKGIIDLKFTEGRLQSLAFGDILLYAMNEYCKDFTQSIEKTKDILNMTGKVLPVTLDEIKVCAELEDGTTIEGKANIPDVVNSKTSKINRIYITPYSCKPAPRSNRSYNGSRCSCYSTRKFIYKYNTKLISKRCNKSN